MTRRATVPLAHVPTPLEPADRLGAALGLRAGALWVKRDDCTGLALGGNKARKLAYLVADALARGGDTLVTGGGRQSNHARMTAAAARRHGLGCVLALASDPPAEPSGNVVLDLVLGAEIDWLGPGGHDHTEAGIDAACARLRDEGRTPYRVPVGGASPVGTLGYVDAADELRAELPELDLVVCADGSGGTHAGLAVGLGDHARVLGVDVAARDDLADAVPQLAREVAVEAGRPEPAGELQLDVDHRGPGYARPSDAGHDALLTAARTEGLVLDPVYTAKALAALASRVADGRIAPDCTVVFLHTGGSPALWTGASLARLAGP